MHIEIDGREYTIIYNSPDPNSLYCEGCEMELDWQLHKEDPDLFNQIHEYHHNR